jgi:beta-galactosidase
MAKRPFVWGKYIWVLADFGSSIRQEGDTAGINDKGLVTYDRQVKKDAFYFYKANWNPEPMLYLADRRHTRRSQSLTSVKVYTNLKNVELLVNGRSYGKQPPSAYGIIRWEGVALADGRNQIKIRGRSGSSILEDADEWILK